MRRVRRLRRPVVVLWVLAPACGELLSGSAPPLEFFNPLVFLVLSALYGSGALLIRDSVRRRDQRWPSILLLGLAYGIYEEGIVVRSFFDPAWQDLDVLAWYGRALGVNWIWAITLTLYHAVVSIAIPIALAEMMFPERRAEPWLTRRGRRIHTLLFLSLIPFGALMGMHAPPLAYVGCLLAIGLLALAARRWPERTPRTTPPIPSNRRIRLTGLGAMVGLIVVMWILPNLDVPVGITAGGALALPVIVWRRVWRMGALAWTDTQRLALISGALSLWIGLAFIHELNGILGMSVVGLGAIVGLRRLGKRIRQRTAALESHAILPPEMAPVPGEMA